ncbi:MAG: DUF4383 domain-containing protein [Chitinophagaceae bacterium]|nr:DUF4383 domain-containing protein [Chitinophagaceae bacterium]
MTTRTAAIIFGIAFLAVGLLGYTNNPIIADSETAMFHADSVHSIVHIVSGVLFLLFGLAAPGSARGFLKLFGIIYFILGVWGLAQFGTAGMGKLLGFLHVNGADNFLHIGLGLLIFLAGVFARPPQLKP